MSKPFKDVTMADYRNQFYDNADHTLVDVRSEWEFNSGHIPGAINIPLEQISWRMNEIPRNRPVVVVCQSGNRSQAGARAMVEAGIQAYNLQGGTMIWMMNGLPLER